MKLQMKSKLTGLVLLMLLLSLMLVGCGGSDDSAKEDDSNSADGSGEAVTLKLAHQWAAQVGS